MLRVKQNTPLQQFFSASALAFISVYQRSRFSRALHQRSSVSISGQEAGFRLEAIGFRGTAKQPGAVEVD
jgi:hypothetical protein